MTLHDRAILWVTGRFEGVEPSYRRDVAATTRELTANRGLRVRSAEFAALAGLALRLRSRHRTGDRAAVTWRQGLYIGANLLLFAMTAHAWAYVADARPGAYAAAALPALALAAAATCGLTGRRFAAATLAGIGGLATAFAGPGSSDSGALAGAALVATAGLLAGIAPPPAGRGSVVAALLLSAVAWPVALATGPAASAGVASAVLTGLCPAVLIALGPFDPRLAAAGMVVWFSRLVVGDLGAFAHALTFSTEDGRQVLLLRWFLMASGVGVAWLVTRGSIRRLARP